MNKIETDFMKTNNEKAQNEGEKTPRKIQIIVAELALIGVISTALINAGKDVYLKKMDFLEKERVEEQERQQEFERKQDKESLVIQDRVWEVHAGIKYLGYLVGTGSETTQFRVRPYLFCDVIYSTGKEVHCWIRNHYTQEEYLSEAGKVKLLEVYEPEVLENRLEKLLSEDKDVEGVKSYTLLLVEYSMREVSPEYVCYCLQEGKLQIREPKWGSELLSGKEKYFFDAECSNWEWIE